MANSEPTSDYKCKLCLKEFDSIQAIFRHELTHMVSGQDAETGTKRRKFGKRLMIRKKQKTDPKILQPQVDELFAEIENEVRDGLMSCREGSELNVLCRIFQPHPNYLSEVFSVIIADLENTLLEDRQAGQWNIRAFGSTIKGMAFKDSDIDFYICPQFRDANFKTHYNRVSKILQRSQLFGNTFTIRGARVPIIKCTHLSTGVNLDINMSSSFGVYNSQFICKLLNFDRRIHPFMLIIKIWAKSWGITKTSRMTNYCLLLLVIFFLQACEEPILPPLNNFKWNTQPLIIDGVNFAFNENLPNQTRNRSNIKELVNEFFIFYSIFDFSRNIVCPALGRPLSQVDFSTGQLNFPEYTDHLQVMRVREQELRATNMSDWHRDISSSPLECATSMVVQDPFCLNNNAAKSIMPQLMDMFKRQLIYGRKICGDRSNTSASLLLRLFYEAPTAINAPLAPAGKQTTKQTDEPKPITGGNNLTAAATKTKQSFFCRLAPIETELFFVRMHLRRKDPTGTYEKKDIDKVWSENMVAFIERILNDLYKMQFTRKSHQGKNNAFNMNGTLEANAETWVYRKCDTKRGYATFLQDQANFADLLYKQRNSSERIIFCNLSVAVEPDFEAINISVKNALPSNKNTLNAFFTDFTARLRVFVKAYFEKLAMETPDLSET